jgi:hypothetical protein
MRRALTDAGKGSPMQRQQMLRRHIVAVTLVVAASATTHVVDQAVGPSTTITPAITAASNLEVER